MFKNFLKNIVVFFLRIEAKLILKKYKPKIVAITGTVGKTSTKDAIALVLAAKFNVRKSEKSYNRELGVPLTIIGAKSAWLNIFQWILILFRGVKILFSNENYPQWLVLEMGVDKPGDMENLISWIIPDIVVFTALAEIPVHVEKFQSSEDLIKEKEKLMTSLKKDGCFVLNGDDKIILNLKESKTITYGFEEGLDLMASNYNISPDGITFKADYKGTIIPVRIPSAFGKQYVYTALAALATGISLDLNLVEMVETLSKFKPPPGRLNLLEGVKKSFILDDTYNSSPIAALAALEVLKTLPAERKIAVLGDMLELGKFTIEEHKKLGRLVKDSNIDLLVTIGPRAKFISDEARATGFNSENIFEFSNSEEAKIPLQEKIKQGDLILIKGSQAMRMEKIVEEIMAHPEQKEELLVRQEPEWQNK
ncbi:MAG: UDP-N-acetylmuramoyl-tripeptide--D-alanyl-D-alanine ligase [Candidatus Parcubacteria bacterium]|nr:UDP-N-acetylmuramoyl-tripeptide--D-alanyl-D-alanine ligase [Candidatus Parcubacteria bacterium]